MRTSTEAEKENKMTLSTDWQEEFSELESAEDYCNFFGIDYDKALLARNRLAVLQRFHDLLPQDWGTLDYAGLRALFVMAYANMTNSSAREEQLFKIFKPPVVSIPLSSIGGRRKGATCL